MRFSARRAAEIVFFACVAVLLLSHAMAKPLDHDEHQFVASGWLLAHAGLLPYRDYPYFHLPYLTLLYAAAYLFTGYPMLVARLIETAAAFGSMILLCALVVSVARSWKGEAIGAAAVIMFLFNPITEFTAGMTWNHDVALLTCLGAFAAFRAAAPTRSASLVSGLLLAIATGVRATFVLAVPVYVVFGFFTTNRKETLLNWLGGFIAGSVPNLVFLVLVPAQFWFGNVTYAALNTAWRSVNEYERAMTLGDKVDYVLATVIGWSSTLPLVAALLVALVLVWRGTLLRRDGNPPDRRAFWLAAALCLALGIAAFLPTPTFDQYFYAAIPFAVLAVAYAALSSQSALGVGMVSLMALYSVVAAPAPLNELANLASPARWTPLRVHDAGRSILASVPEGTIVTLAPIYPLEAGLPIFPELVTGPFAYRVGVLMSPEERKAQRVVDIDDLPAFVEQRKPAAFLLGFEPEQLEEPIAQYAQSQHYRLVDLPSGKHLWLTR